MCTGPTSEAHGIDGVARLMVSCYLLYPFGYYLASLLSTDSHLHEGPVDIVCLMNLRFSPADIMAASFIRFSRSAPVKPDGLGHLQIHILAERLFLGMDLKISSRPFTSGRPTATFLSKRPGRRIAGSRISTRFVAAMTIMPSLTPKPSISTAAGSVSALSSWAAAHTCTLRRATAQNSSIKHDTGEFFLASSNRSRRGKRPHPQTSPRNQN